MTQANTIPVLSDLLQKGRSHEARQQRKDSEDRAARFAAEKEERLASALKWLEKHSPDLFSAMTSAVAHRRTAYGNQDAYEVHFYFGNATAYLRWSKRDYAVDVAVVSTTTCGVCGYPVVLGTIYEYTEGDALLAAFAHAVDNPQACPCLAEAKRQATYRAEKPRTVSVVEGQLLDAFHAFISQYTPSSEI